MTEYDKYLMAFVTKGVEPHAYLSQHYQEWAFPQLQ